MNENFGTLFLDSLKDGTYNNGLREKLSSISRWRHKSLEDSIDDDLQNQKSPPSVNLWEAKIWTLIDTVRLSTLGSLETAIPIWIQEIINNHIPEQSEWNPSYYPEIPDDAMPKWKIYTNRQVAQIKMSRDIDFIENNIVVSTIPLSSEDINNEFIWLNHTNPNIFGKTVIHEEHKDIIKWFTQTPNFSYPEIINCIGYMLNIYTDPKTHKQYLSYIYVFKNTETINSLLDFLKSLKVENMDDLKNSQEFFTHMLLNK